ncbi:ABC transporter substrate-binding protein [Bradyrhizobium sp. 177]|nr:ABC transporter substrate-binding protein [Bradyrhizobium sp. 177]MCK1552685.1 ABC transporter substrate-binding protein [Bradyrhizobium sp. 177]
MAVRINRRRFVGMTAGVAGGVLPSMTNKGLAQFPGQLTIRTGSGGSYGQAVIESYVKPFQADTGIKVTAITDLTNPAQLELMVTTKSVTADVVALAQGAALAAAKRGYLEEIDYSIYKKEELDSIEQFAKQPFGVGSVIYSFVMVYSPAKFSSKPTAWADLWNVKKFPGIRVFSSGQLGIQGPWEEALLADGAPADKLYPMDIDRIFASLDEIKPFVRKWWTTGAEIQKIMHENVADILNSYDGRAVLSIEQGAPLEISRKQSKLTWDYWAIPKGSPNVDNAQKFIEFATRAERQAAFAQRFPIGPTNRNAYKLIPDNVARKLASYPDYMASSIPMDMNWYAQIGSDGLSNGQRLAQRWNDWILI